MNIYNIQPGDILSFRFDVYLSVVAFSVCPADFDVAWDMLDFTVEGFGESALDRTTWAAIKSSLYR